MFLLAGEPNIFLASPFTKGMMIDIPSKVVISRHDLSFSKTTRQLLREQCEGPTRNTLGVP